jgi:hypothetical protein
VIPVKVGSPSFRVAYYNPGLNDEKAKVYLDLLQEKRDDAQVTWAVYQNRTAWYFNKQVVPKKFQLGDWVLRKVSLMTKDPTKGKMRRPLQGSRMPSERGLSPDDRDREDTPKIMEPRVLEEILYVILCFSPQFYIQ